MAKEKYEIPPLNLRNYTQLQRGRAGEQGYLHFGPKFLSKGEPYTDSYFVTVSDKMLAEGEVSPARAPWSADNTFVRSRFIVKRLKRMRSKTRSLTEDVSGSYLYHSPEPSSLPFEPSCSYESLPSPREEDEHFQCCSPEKREQDLTVEDIVKDIVNLSIRNRHRLREENVSFQEESVEPLSCRSPPKSTAEVVFETDKGETAEREDELTTSVITSEPEPEPQVRQYPTRAKLTKNAFFPLADFFFLAHIVNEYVCRCRLVCYSGYSLGYCVTEFFLFL